MRAGKRVAVDIVLDRVREEKNQFLNRGDGGQGRASNWSPVAGQGAGETQQRWPFAAFPMLSSQQRLIQGALRRHSTIDGLLSSWYQHASSLAP